MKTKLQDSQGYTLMEMMVVIAVLGILLTVGLPQLNAFMHSNRMVANNNDLASALKIARSEAIREGARATICQSSNPTATPPGCSTVLGGWKEGWIVFIDSDGVVGQYNAATDGPLLRIYDGVAGNNVTVTPMNSSIDNYVSFTSRGVPKSSSGAAQSGVFKICDDRGLKNASGNVIARGVELSASGKVRTTKLETKIVSCP
ncbi:MAG: GspH/FimT family pseudopilin [Gammaproteobacteria bacterium]